MLFRDMFRLLPANGHNMNERTSEIIFIYLKPKKGIVKNYLSMALQPLWTLAAFSDS
jgi:hypothetical protein